MIVWHRAGDSLEGPQPGFGRGQLLATPHSYYLRILANEVQLK